MLGKTWPRWNWIESGVLPLLGALMWATCLAFPLDALLGFVTDQRASGGAGPAVVVLLLGGTAAARVAPPTRAGRWLVAVTGLLALVAAEWWLLYRAAFAPWDLRWLGEAGRLSAGSWVVALLATLLWWRGLTAAWTSHDALARDFVLGVLVLAGSLLAVSSAPALAGQLVEPLVFFLVTAWATLSLAAVAQARRMSSTEARPLHLDRFWLLSVLSLVISLIAAGLILTGLATPAALAALLARLQPLGALVRQALWLVLYAVTYVVFLFLTPLIDFLRSLVGKPNSTPYVSPTPFKDFVEEAQSSSAALAPGVEMVLRSLLVAGVLLVIGWLFARALRRFAATDDEGVRESRELIWSWDLWRAQLAGWLARRRGRRPPLFPPLGGDRLNRLYRMRAAYRRLLALALRHAHPRQPGQTPEGYLPGVLSLWPAEQALLAALTKAYTSARYGEQPPTPEALTDFQAGLDRLTHQDQSGATNAEGEQAA